MERVPFALVPTLVPRLDPPMSRDPDPEPRPAERALGGWLPLLLVLPALLLVAGQFAHGVTSKAESRRLGLARESAAPSAFELPGSTSNAVSESMFESMSDAMSGAGSDALSDAPSQGDEGYVCRGVDGSGQPLSERVVEPPQIELCAETRVVTRLRVDCAPPPLSVVLNVDRSGSMFGQPILDVIAAGHAMLDALDLGANADTRVALVSHGEPPLVDVPFGAGEAELRAGLDRLTVASEEVPDNLPGAIDTGRELLAMDRQRVGYQPIELMLLLSDGGQTFAANQVIEAAERAEEAGILLVSVCVENRLASCPTMAAVASRPELSYSVDGTGELGAIFEAVALRARALAAREVRLVERLPEGLRYLPGSADPPAMVDGQSGQLSWRLRFLPREGVTVSYRLAPRWLGDFALPAEASLVDPLGRDTLLPMPPASLRVEGSCGLETATPTITPSPTLRPSATPTVTPTPSLTPVPRPIHLPMLFRGHCLTREQPADVVLLIDASGSMNEQTRGGRSKLAAVQAGALEFVDQLRAQDRAAVIAFNDRAALRSGLTDDRARLQAAIEGIQVAPGTRIDVALYAAALELAGPSRRPESRGVIVLMTDGRPGAEHRESSLEAAAGARAAGHQLFAIGVGLDVDRLLLEIIAGEPSRYYPAEDAEAIEAIYREIAQRIPCR